MILLFNFRDIDNSAGIFINLGRIHLAMDNRPLAAKFFQKAVAESVMLGYFSWSGCRKSSTVRCLSARREKRLMLQHSRASSGQKVLTDINALSNEYIRLSYHGLRAKDKSFNATMNTDFDETIGSINIVPQEIGRVILNLINNAFYAVSAKASATAESKYEPTVSISTKKRIIKF